MDFVLPRGQRPARRVCHYINGQETCTDSISHTRAIIFFPFVTINATIGSIVASTKTQSSDAWPVRLAAWD